MSNTLWSTNRPVVQLTSSHLLSRQLQHFFARLQHSILSTVLEQLQMIFRSRWGQNQWMLAFVNVIGLAMASELQQKELYLTQNARVRTEGLKEDEAYGTAQKACRDIDQQMAFIFQLFALKSFYERKQQWSVGFNDESSAHFIRQLRDLIMENSKSLLPMVKTYY
jgi:hypothetical protein